MNQLHGVVTSRLGARGEQCSGLCASSMVYLRYTSHLYEDMLSHDISEVYQSKLESRLLWDIRCHFLGMVYIMTTKCIFLQKKQPLKHHEHLRTNVKQHDKCRILILPGVFFQTHASLAATMPCHTLLSNDIVVSWNITYGTSPLNDLIRGRLKV